MFHEEITYLVANYNRADYIDECLASLQAQSDPAWRAVVLDDGSTDESVDRIRRHVCERIRLVRHERNRGYIAALQRLIEEAETDIVAILDADDALERDANERLRTVYAEDPEAAFVYSQATEYERSFSSPIRLIGGAIPAGGTAIRDGPLAAIRCFRRSTYARTGGLDPSMCYAEDRDLVYKLEEVTRPRFIEAPLYRYRRLPGSHTRDQGSREEGARNARRARRAALARRATGGLARLAAEAMIWSDYVAYSERYLGLTRSLARRIASVSAGLWRWSESRDRSDPNDPMSRYSGRPHLSAPEP